MEYKEYGLNQKEIKSMKLRRASEDDIIEYSHSLSDLNNN